MNQENVEKREPQKVLRYLTEVEVSEMTAFALPTLRNWRFQGRGLPYMKVGKSVRYSLTDVEEYMAEHRINPDKM